MNSTGALIGLVTAALGAIAFFVRFVRGDDRSQAVVDQQSTLITDMATAAGELRISLTAITTEVAELRSENARIERRLTEERNLAADEADRLRAEKARIEARLAEALAEAERKTVECEKLERELDQLRKET